MSPSVSIIIPAFNAQEFIGRAIASALAQQRVTIEVLVIDDSSYDNTASLVQDICKQDSRVRLLKTTGNSGPGAARNIGIECASHDWVAFLDVDDWMAPDRLHTLLETAHNNQLDFVADSYYLSSRPGIAPHGRKYCRLSDVNELSRYDLASFIRVGLGSIRAVIRRRFLTRTNVRFSTEIWRGEDTLFYAQLLLQQARFALLNTPMYFRSEPGHSLSRSDKQALFKDLLLVYAMLRKSIVGNAPEHLHTVDAIFYRIKVVNDALAAARWQSFIAGFPFIESPEVSSLMGLVRHVLLRHKRYQMQLTSRIRRQLSSQFPH